MKYVKLQFGSRMMATGFALTEERVSVCYRYIPPVASVAGREAASGAAFACVGPISGAPQSSDFACPTYLKRYILVMRWRVEFLDEEVKAALGAFPADIRS